MTENWEVQWKDYYRILQVHPSAEQEVVKAAYDKLARKYHPDVNQISTANKRMTEINEAFEILRDPEKRGRYHLMWLQKTEGRTQTRSNLDNISTNPPRKRVRGYLIWGLALTCLVALAIVLIIRNHQPTPSSESSLIPTTTTNIPLNVKIKDITLPVKAQSSSGNLTYEQIFTVVNLESFDVRVRWEGSSSITGIFDSGYISVNANDSREIKRSYSYAVDGVEIVTYTLYYGDIALDTFSATHEISK